MSAAWASRRGARSAEAVLARRSHRAAHRVVVTQARHFGKVSGLRFPRPAADAAEHARIRRRNARQRRHRLGQLEPVQAQVVGAAFQERDARRPAKRLRHRRQVAVEQLVLEGARARRDDHLPAGQQRGHEIGEGLAGAGAGLDREQAARGERFADPVGHELLLAARFEAVDDAGERPVRPEQPAEFALPAHEPRARAM
jgi:hypothetical protein